MSSDLSTSLSASLSQLRVLTDSVTRLSAKLQRYAQIRSAGSEGSASNASARATGPASKRVGSFAGPAGFLWKPISDSTGTLAILLPSGMTGAVSGVIVLGADGRVLERGRFGGVGNGEREHFRFTRTGAAFPVGSHVMIQFKSGATQSITIQTPAARVEGR